MTEIMGASELYADLLEDIRLVLRMELVYDIMDEVIWSADAEDSDRLEKVRDEIDSIGEKYAKRVQKNAREYVDKSCLYD